MARGLLGRNSNLHIRQRRRDALKEADLVILAGMVTNIKNKILRIRKLCVIFGSRSEKYTDRSVERFYLIN